MYNLWNNQERDFTKYEIFMMNMIKNHFEIYYDQVRFIIVLKYFYYNEK